MRGETLALPQVGLAAAHGGKAVLSAEGVQPALHIMRCQPFTDGSAQTPDPAVLFDSEYRPGFKTTLAQRCFVKRLDGVHAHDAATDAVHLQ